MVTDRGYSARDLKRPGIVDALERLQRAEAAGLVVAKLDRLSRSMLDFAALMERARREGWALIALDLGVNTSTPAGEMMANMLATFAQFERRLIAQRTKEALAVKRSQGIHTGRRSTLPPPIVRRIKRRRAAGWTLQRIADKLNAERVPTGQGGAEWRPSSVRAVLRARA